MINEILIFVAGVFAGFVGTAAGGGGGFISFFTLIQFGVPIHAAIGTNKLGNLGLYPLSIINYANAKKIAKRLVVQLIILSVIGSIVGSLITISIDATILNIVVAVILVFVLGFYLLNKEIGVKTGKKYRSWWFFYFLSKVYSGLFSAGSGLFSVAVLTMLRGVKAVKAIADHISAGLIGAVISAVIFVAAGYVHFSLAGALFLGCLIGGFLGSKVAIKEGDKWVKRFIILIIVITIAKLIMEIY